MMEGDASYTFVPGFCCGEDHVGDNLDSLADDNIIVLEWGGEEDEQFVFPDDKVLEGWIELTRQSVRPVDLAFSGTHMGIYADGTKLKMRAPTGNFEFPMPRAITICGKRIEIGPDQRMCAMLMCKPVSFLALPEAA